MNAQVLINLIYNARSLMDTPYGVLRKEMHMKCSDLTQSELQGYEFLG